MQRNLWNKVIKYIAEDKVKNPKEYIDKINEKMWPFEFLLKLGMQQTSMKKRQNQQLEEKMLYNSIYGLNKFKEIKQQIIENNLKGVVQGFMK